MDESLKKLGQLIKNKRKSKGLTQETLANLLGYADRSTISKIERGDLNIAASKLNSIANLLDILPEELINTGANTKLNSDEDDNNSSIGFAKFVTGVGDEYRDDATIFDITDFDYMKAADLQHKIEELASQLVKGIGNIDVGSKLLEETLQNLNFQFQRYYGAKIAIKNKNEMYNRYYKKIKKD